MAMVGIPKESRDRARIQSSEWRFVLIGSLVVLAISSVPYALGALLATDERVFGGMVYGVEDGYSYLAKMRQGAEGAWLFHIPYTAEPHPGTIIYLLYLLLGKVAALLPWGSLTTRLVCVSHTARVAFGLLLLLTIYRFLAVFTGRIAVRRLAWLMTAFGGGLGWLLVLIGQPGWLGSIPLDLILPEGFTFLVLFALPHIALGRSLFLSGLLALLQAWEANVWGDGSWVRWAVLTGLSWLAMGLVVPFYVAVAWAVMGAAWVVKTVRERRILWREFAAAAVAALVSAPIVVYSAYVFTMQPVYATWSAQNLILSPHPLHYVVAYGLPLALAMLAVRQVWRDDGPAWLALAWVGVVPLLVYLPISVQRRLAEGVQIPLSLLAAWGMHEIQMSVVWRRVVCAMLLIVMSLTNGLLVGGSCLALRGQPAPIYRDAEEIAALDWLSAQVDADDVVLASYETGNYLPVRVGARVVLGHGPETVDIEDKRKLVAAFFDSSTSDDWRRRLLEQYGVDYVFVGPRERLIGDFEPAHAAYLRQVYCGGRYVVFEVKH